MDLLLALSILVTTPTAANIVGTVRDAETSEPLVGAAVLLPELDRGTLTDSTGRYQLIQVPPGPHHLEVRLLGYAPRTLHALVPRAGELEIDLTLRPEPVSTHPVEVRAPLAVRGGTGSPLNPIATRRRPSTQRVNAFSFSVALIA